MVEQSEQSGERRHSQTVAWIGGGFGLLLFYVLSPGPFQWAFKKNLLPMSVVQVISIFYYPLEWAYRHYTWVHKFYDWYFGLFP